MEFVRRFPWVIQLIILSYTYQPQPKNLLKDIVHYKKSQYILLNVYDMYWSYYELDSNEYKQWLLNDLLSYANNHKATIYGYVYKFYTIFNRIATLETYESIVTYIHRLGKKEIDTQINIVLGLFNMYEREDFVKDSLSTYCSFVSGHG